jgi:threonyl-tRNA synthetase
MPYVAHLSIFRTSWMKLMCFHASRFSYTLDHPTPVADPGNPDEGAEFSNALVAFVAFEPNDQPKISAAAREILKIARKADAATIVVNPFAHLSSRLAPPDEAKDDGRQLVEMLSDTFEGETAYGGFGWYKAFSVDVYGHASSQMFREF